MEKKRNRLKDEHKDLHGMLMVVNHQLNDLGAALALNLLFGGLAFCVALHKRWIDNVLGINLDHLRGVGVYFLIAIAVLIIFGAITKMRERKIYQAAKEEILEYLIRHQISSDALLADIAFDDHLSEIRNKLLEDKSIRKQKLTQYP